MNRTLVVAYSRSGRTRSIAERVAKDLGADLELITEHRSRRGMLGYLRSGYEALMRRQPRIVLGTHDPFDYDLVVIGTPIWNYSLSSPVRSWIEMHKGAFKSVAFFCTMGSGGEARVFSQMTEIAGRLPVATLAIRDTELGKPDLINRIDVFSSKLLKKVIRIPVATRPPAAAKRAPAPV